MREGDTPPDDVVAVPPGRASQSPVSVALLAGLAFMPIVVAAGFLTDRSSPAASGDMAAVALRGGFDAEATIPLTRATRAGS